MSFVYIRAQNKPETANIGIFHIVHTATRHFFKMKNWNFSKISQFFVKLYHLVKCSVPNFVEIYFEIFLLFEVTIPNAKIYLSSTVVRFIWDGLLYSTHNTFALAVVLVFLQQMWIGLWPVEFSICTYIFNITNWVPFNKSKK